MKKHERKKEIDLVSMATATVALVQMSHGGITPALGEMGKVFSNVSDTTLALLNTMPVLTSIPSSFISGKLVRKGISFRSMLLVGLGLLLAGGLSSIFCKGMGAVLLFRAIFGVGLGAVSHSISTFTLSVFPDNQVKQQLALNSLAANFGSILFQLAGGYLCLLGCQYTFLCYLMVLVPIYAVWAIIKPTLGKMEKEPCEATKTKRQRNLKNVTFWCGIYFLFYVAFYVFVNNMSGVIVGNGYGTSADVAWVLAVFNLGGVTGGYIYRKWLFRMRTYVFLPALFMCIAGFGCVLMAEEICALYIAAGLFGSGFGIFAPAAMYFGGTSVKAEQRSSMVSYMNMANNIGGFSSALLLSALCTLLGLDGKMMHFVFGIVIFSALLGIFLIWSRKMERAQ